MLQPAIILSPIKSVIPAAGGTLEVLLRVQAPDQPVGNTHKVTPKRLALVVDRSGSMSGCPLSEALKCVTHIADRMTEIDQMALVVYDHTVSTLVPLTPMVSAQAIHRAVADVQSGGSTDLFAGWKEGTRQLETGIKESISRVLLLSDGNANHGLQDVDAITMYCREALASGISTTTVGLGRSFNEYLMIAMAHAGGGQQYYGQTASDLYDNFDEEFSLLQALCLRYLDVKLIAAAGVRIETVGLVQQHADGSYRLADLAWGSQASLMLRLHISPSAPGDVRDLLAVTLSARTLDDQTVTAQHSMLRLTTLDQAGFDAAPSDEYVTTRLQEFEFSLASQALRDLAHQGDISGMWAMLHDLRGRFDQNPWLKDKLSRLCTLAMEDIEMMSKEVSFSQLKMSRRLNVQDERAYYMDETHSTIPSFLRKKAEEGKGRKHR